MSSAIMVSRVEHGWTWAVINDAGETTACGAAQDQAFAMAAAQRISRLAQARPGNDHAPSATPANGMDAETTTDERRELGH